MARDDGEKITIREAVRRLREATDGEFTDIINAVLAEMTIYARRSMSRESERFIRDTTVYEECETHLLHAYRRFLEHARRELERQIEKENASVLRRLTRLLTGKGRFDMDRRITVTHIQCEDGDADV